MKKQMKEVGYRRALEKILLKMKLTAAILLFCLASASASTYAQNTRLDISSEGKNILELFREIEEKSEFYFFYQKEDLKELNDVSVDVKNATVMEILDQALAGTNLQYKVVDRYIIVRKSGDNFGDNIIAAKQQQQQRAVSGKVTDDTNQPLPGVTVVIKGTTQGTVTNTDGEYSLANLPENATLQFSFVGMRTQEIAVANQTTIHVTMKVDAIGLDEVVAIGYGVRTRSDLTGAVESVNSDEITKRAVSNVSELLRGRIAGLNTSVSNSTSGNSDILIRGKTSLKANNSPLIVLDGMVYPGSMSEINPLDIENIDVLKDASAAAVYGARSASGVIIITTKKGRKGEPTINVSSSTGISYLKDIQEIKSPEEYISSRTDYFEGATTRAEGYYRSPNTLPSGMSNLQWRELGAEPSTLTDNQVWFGRNQFSAIELKNYEAGNTINWFDLVFQTGLRQDYSVSVAGGTERSTHFFSINMVDNEGYLAGQSYKSIRSRANLDTRITDFLKIGLNTQFTHNDDSPYNADMGQAVRTSPFGDRYLEDGETLKMNPHNDYSAINPFYHKYAERYSTTDRLLGNIYAELKLPFGINYRVNWINSLRWSNDYNFEYSTDERQGSGGERKDIKSYNWNVDQILTWQKEFGDIHKLDATILFNVESYESYHSVASNSIFLPSEILGYHQLSFGTNPLLSGNDTEYKADAKMARLNYILMDKYLFTVAVRQDGYSAFGANNARATFPSGAFAWRLSEEDFFNVEWIDNLKIRTSWGVNGNRDIALYQALASLSNVNYIYNDNGNIQPVSGYTSSRMSNADLKWERTEALNLGVDFSVYNGKLSGSVEGYSMSTTNLILDRALPNVTGYSIILSNLGEIQNKGIEVSLRSLVVDKPNIQWNSQLIYSMNRNKIKSLYGDMVDVFDDNGNVIGQEEASDYSSGWYIGEDIDRYYDFEINGVLQVGQEAEAAKYGLAVGSFRIKDQDDSGDIESRKDEKFLGYSTPRHRINWNNDFTFYNNFEFSFSLDAQLGQSGIDNGHFGGGYAVEQAWEAPRLNGYSYPYWTKNNPINDYAKVGSINPYGSNYYVDRSFFRVQNVTLSYNIPRKQLEAYSLKAVKLSFDVSNLAVFSKWDSWDPESGNPVPMIGTFRLLLTL